MLGVPRDLGDCTSIERTTKAADEQGVSSTYSLPLRVRGNVHAAPVPLGEDDVS